MKNIFNDGDTLVSKSIYIPMYADVYSIGTSNFIYSRIDQEFLVKKIRASSSQGFLVKDLNTNLIFFVSDSMFFAGNIALKNS